MPLRQDLLKSARQHNYVSISGCSQQLSVWEVKITPRSFTAGSLSALNYAKLVLHISLPEQEPECYGTCLTRSKQCFLNWLGMMDLEFAAICLKHNAQNMKTNQRSNSFIMCCGNISNLTFQLKYESSIHNIAFSSGKVILSELGEEYA